MRAALRAAACALLAIAPAAISAALSGDGLGGFPRGPEEAFVARDPDGGRTFRLLIEDGPGGFYEYTSVDLSGTHETAAGGVRAVNAALAEAIRATPEVVREAGAYAHVWTFAGAPMTTLGVYAVHQSEGLLRVPLVILENVAGTARAVETARAFALEEAGDLAINAIPLLLEVAMPEYSEGIESWPTTTSTYDSFRDYPRVYAWTLRRSSPAGVVWEGAYLERLGGYRGGTAAWQDFDGVKSVEVGLALRAAGATTRLAGAYVESELHKDGGDPHVTTHRITVGAASEATGRVPLAGVDLDDRRSGPDVYWTPRHQDSGLTLGAYAAGAWTPLLGARTEARHVAAANGEVEQTRLTSVGAYVAGEYVPLAGVRYHGDRRTTLAWAPEFVAGGGPGARTTGDFEIDVGAFAQGRFVPIAGVTYADDFADAAYAHRSMITAGVHAPTGYVPIVAATYDGERPLVDWARSWVAGDDAGIRDWMVSVGTTADGRYVPLLGARFDDDVPGVAAEHERRYTVGTFLGSYRAFLPLAAATYAGDRHEAAWASAFATGGTLGADAGDWDATGGAYALGRYAPIAEVRYRDAYSDAWDAQTFVTVGARTPDGAFVPLAGATYSSDDPLARSIGTPQSLADDRRAFVTAGVFARGEYVPLVMVENRGDRTSAGVLPPGY